jgi:hypothetical protein
MLLLYAKLIKNLRVYVLCKRLVGEFISSTISKILPSTILHRPVPREGFHVSVAFVTSSLYQYDG